MIEDGNETNMVTKPLHEPLLTVSKETEEIKSSLESEGAVGEQSVYSIISCESESKI